MKDTVYPTYDVLIIGGGAAGMTAAVSAARCGGSVAILEHNTRVGKKILSTGNGKCNYTNSDLGESCYPGSTPGFVMSLFQRFSGKDTVRFFRELGIIPFFQKGYCYPLSRQASAVLDVLRMELERLQVRIFLSERIESLRKEGKLFTAVTESGVYVAKSCILATGGKSYPATGSDGSGYAYAKGFGHTIVEPVPALVPLCSKDPGLKAMAGARICGAVSLLVDGKTVADDAGEVQLTKDGISGIPVFQVSRYAAYGLQRGGKVEAVVNFTDGLSERDVMDELRIRCGNAPANRTMEECLIGWFPKNVIVPLLRRGGISPRITVRKLSDRQIKALASAITGYMFVICDTKGFERAQVTAGGVNTQELWEGTMESRICPGLYFAGEMVDVDGICGGYNLQWAWSSGYVAGKQAVRQVRDK